VVVLVRHARRNLSCSIWSLSQLSSAKAPPHKSPSLVPITSILSIQAPGAHRPLTSSLPWFQLTCTHTRYRYTVSRWCQSGLGWARALPGVVGGRKVLWLDQFWHTRNLSENVCVVYKCRTGLLECLSQLCSFLPALLMFPG
jgi:hypothetical protein